MHCRSYAFGILARSAQAPADRPGSAVCFGECRNAVEQLERFRFGFGGKEDERSFCAMLAVSVQDSGFYAFGDDDTDWNVGCTVEKAQVCGDHVRNRDGHGHPPSVMPSALRDTVAAVNPPM